MTLGTPASGVWKAPYFTEPTFINFWVNRAYMAFVYASLSQEICAPCGYTVDSKDYDRYIKNSRFLPILNNQVDHPKWKSNKANFSNLNKLVLVMFEQE
jgi:hypothetical protein